MLANGKDAVGGAVYERHRPEQTLLYRIVEEPGGMGDDIRRESMLLAGIQRAVPAISVS